MPSEQTFLGRQFQPLHEPSLQHVTNLSAVLVSLQILALLEQFGKVLAHLVDQTILIQLLLRHLPDVPHLMLQNPLNLHPLNFAPLIFVVLHLSFVLDGRQPDVPAGCRLDSDLISSQMVGTGNTLSPHLLLRPIVVAHLPKCCSFSVFVEECNHPIPQFVIVYLLVRILL